MDVSRSKKKGATAVDRYVLAGFVIQKLGKCSGSLIRNTACWCLVFLIGCKKL
jgi:hypothetical protein